MTDKGAQVDWDDDKHGRLQAELECAREWANYNARLVEERDIELARLRTEDEIWDKHSFVEIVTERDRLCAELAQAREEATLLNIVLTDANELHAEVRAELTDACAARDALAQKCDELKGKRAFNAQTTRESITLRTKLMKARVGLNEREIQLAQVREELAQARTELKDLQGANREYGRQLADVTENREFWYKEAHATLSMAEGLRRQLAGMEAERDFWRGKRNDERLATLDAAEAALADARRVARLWFRRARGAELERGHRTLTVLGVPLEDENGKLPILERIEQMLRTERQLRRKAEAIARDRDNIFYEEYSKRLVAEQRAEALAALVNEEVAKLLERLSRDVLDHCKSDIPCVMARYKRNAKGGYALAAQIREVLDDNKA